MRIVIDLQGAQGANRQRGIGCYSLDFARALVRNAGRHEILIALNGGLAHSVGEIRAAFHGLLPLDALRLWTAPGPLALADQTNTSRARDAELIREAFLASLAPDVVLVSSLFEGLGDDAATGVGSLVHLPTAVVLYDLIPLLNPADHLTNEAVRSWYMGKIEALRRADLLLAISQSSADETVSALQWEPARVCNISAAVSERFRPLDLSPQEQAAVMARYGLDRDFLMYLGGPDPRKNTEGLIAAYARLPRSVRDAHQLALVCGMGETDRAHLTGLAEAAGLDPTEVVLTGHVPDDDLVALYNCCKAFVFPRRHEGFGLPALEAMKCGKAVIASNTSSLPEVVGRADALFDPWDEAAMAAMMEKVLADADFRGALEVHGLEQARAFSWDRMAVRALAAMEQAFGARAGTVTQPSGGAPVGSEKPRLAFVSPLPPARSGIAHYSADLLGALADHYEIDVVVDQEEVTDPFVVAHLPIRSVDWFRAHAGHFDRVLYHMGNSGCHRHMFALLEEIPGVVVLHDFFLSSIQAHMGPQNWHRAVLESHGVEGLAALSRMASPEEGIWTFPANLPVLQNATGVIVHSAWSRQLASQWYGAGAASDWAVVPMVRRGGELDPARRVKARRQLGFADDEVVVVSFGDVVETKLSVELVDAFAAARAGFGPRLRLVFAGRSEERYGEQVLWLAREAGVADAVSISGWLDDEDYRDYLHAADMAVQLRTKSRGETSAAALECLAWGVPLIVNTHGAMAEIDPGAALIIPDKFDAAELEAALVRLASDASLRATLGASARALLKAQHSPDYCAARYREAIEAFAAAPRRAIGLLVDRLAGAEPDEGRDRALAPALAQTFPPLPRTPALLVDVSTIAERDIHTGIQRVVRSILVNLLAAPPQGFTIVPVYRSGEGGYRLALRFLERIGAIASTGLAEDLIDAYAGDVFLGLDLAPLRGPQDREGLERLQRLGVRMVHVVYDLLPIRMPQNFPDGSEWFAEWLRLVVSLDGAVCISKAVADDLAAWMAEEGIARPAPFQIGWFHLGADVTSSVPTRGLPSGADEVLARIAQRPTFLMVSTVEPRKGHRLALAAFERLWARGVDVNLAVVGRKGWDVDELAAQLGQHPESGHRLFWPSEVSDEFLERIYAASTCLLVASEGEGFGLPLIEAAQHGLPVLARDLPVFREVAGAHAAYFAATGPDELADAVEAWLGAWRKGEHVRSQAMPWLTWRESAQQLLHVLGLATDAGQPAPDTASGAVPDLVPAG